jgi:KDO2-lipid IV(A) lauroyltransferase
MVRAVAIVADQYPGLKKDKKFFVNFLHQETAFFFGANQLATLTKYPVLFASVHKVKRGFYEVTLIPIAEPPYEKDSPVIIERYAAAAEKVIREYPAGWLWSHNRWKKRHLKQASAKYPPASTAS